MAKRSSQLSKASGRELYCLSDRTYSVSGSPLHYKIAWRTTRGGPFFRRKIIVISRSDLIRNGSLSVRLKLSGHLLHGRDALKFRPCLHQGRLRGTLCVDYIHLHDGSNSLMLLRCKLEGDQWRVAGKQFPVCVPFHHDATCLTTWKSFNLYCILYLHESVNVVIGWKRARPMTVRSEQHPDASAPCLFERCDT